MATPETHSTAHPPNNPRPQWPTTSPTRASVVFAVIPDTDGEMRGRLEDIEELLLQLAGGQEHVTTTAESPLTHPLGSWAAADALGNIGAALAAAERQAPATLLAPDGRYELVPLLRISLDQADLDVLGAVAQQLAHALAVGGCEPVADLIADHPSAHLEDLAAWVARLHAVLSLPWDDDAQTLAGRLQPAGRTVLTAEEVAGYARLAERFIAIWHRTSDGGLDPLAPLLYGTAKWPAG